MDLKPFHPTEGPGPDRNYKMQDKLNGWTKLLPCRFLEWSGWYNYQLAQRLLGHYRLFQHFRKDFTKWKRDIPATRAYILQYQGMHAFKYFIARIMALIYSTFTRKAYYPVVEIAGINRLLVHECSFVLEEFLAGADDDFEAALVRAVQQINDPYFLSRTGKESAVFSPTLLLQVNNILNNPTTHHHQLNDLSSTTHNYNYNDLSHKEVTIQPVGKEGAKGKEKGVFSKRQDLIFFDLLSEGAKVEKIDYSKANKFDAIADLFFALTGKSKTSFLEEMNDCRTRGLYEYHTLTERNQLVITLTNLSDTFRKAGFRSISHLADRKINELESNSSFSPPTP